ncbi:MAG: T9SS type A sorting domain-containing protein [Bacteroidetes bacterium]|nr:T9SS type A sorting domain-containing protein [Bacteroidota bacterium]
MGRNRFFCLEFWRSVERNIQYQHSLHDLTGNLITSVELQQGAGAYKMDLRNLSNGIYLVSVTDNDSGEKRVTKLIKQ